MQVVVGRIGRAHGVRGEVSVDVRTDEPERRFAAGAVLAVAASADDAPGREVSVASARAQGGRLLVRFEQILDRDAAEALRGAVVLAELAPGASPDDPEEFYDAELVGLHVRTASGEPAGTVVGVRHLPGQELLVVADSADGEVLVPFVSALVPRVCVANGYLEVADVPGLLDPDTAETAAE